MVLVLVGYKVVDKGRDSGFEGVSILVGAIPKQYNSTPQHHRQTQSGDSVSVWYLLYIQSCRVTCYKHCCYCSLERSLLPLKVWSDTCIEHKHLIYSYLYQRYNNRRATVVSVHRAAKHTWLRGLITLPIILITQISDHDYLSLMNPFVLLVILHCMRIKNKT